MTRAEVYGGADRRGRMARTNDDALEAGGWRLDHDDDADELWLEHLDSGATYVLDAEGQLTVVGEEAPSGELRELQATLAAAMAEDEQDGANVNARGPAGCAVKCESNGEVTIESNQKITMDAPTVEVSAQAKLDLASNGTAEVSSSGPLTLQGAIIQLN